MLAGEANFRGMATESIVLLSSGDQQVAVEHDASQQIVEVVRYTAHEPPNGLQLLCLDQFLLCKLLLRDVDDGFDQSDGRAGCIPDNGCGPAPPDDSSI